MPKALLFAAGKPMTTIYTEVTECFRNAESEQDLIEAAKSFGAKIRSLKNTSIGFCHEEKIEDIVFVMKKNKENLTEKDISNLSSYICIKNAYAYYRHFLRNFTTLEHPKIAYDKAKSSGSYIGQAH